jgi:hypothetical protein
MFKMLLQILIYIYIYIYIHVVMLLHVSSLQGHLQATLFKDSNSLNANHIVFLRYAVDVSSYLFDLFALRMFLCHIRCPAHSQSLYRLRYPGSSVLS